MQSTEYRVQSVQNREQSTEYRLQSTDYRVQSTDEREYKVQRTAYMVKTRKYSMRQAERAKGVQLRNTRVESSRAHQVESSQINRFKKDSFGWESFIQ